MIYIYDVILNFSDNFFYDFYEWNSSDNLINIKKIPLIHVSKKVIEDFIKYKIKVFKDFLSMIGNKSIFLRRDKDKYNYSVIISSGEKSIGISFNENGFVKYKSAMLIDEEDDTNRIARKQKETKIKYKKYNSDYKTILRCDIERKLLIVKELNKLLLNKEYDKLKYIYYEIFNETIIDSSSAFNKLIKGIDENIDSYYLAINELKTK